MSEHWVPSFNVSLYWDVNCTNREDFTQRDFTSTSVYSGQLKENDNKMFTYTIAWFRFFFKAAQNQEKNP